MTSWTLEEVREADIADPLRGARELFHLPDGLVYLDGNSLGCLPKTVAARVARVIGGEWGEGLIRSWNKAGWIDLPRAVGAKIAPLIGAAEGEVLATDSTSVNIYKLVGAALGMRPGRKIILTEEGNFPTDNYIMAGIADHWPGGVECRAVPRGELLDALDENVAVFELTHVNYRTGEVFDMEGITRAAHAAGALVIWDLCHTAGAMPVDLAAAEADFAVGCGYKFLNGGPGAPAFLYVAERHQPVARSPLWGWMGHASPFAFAGGYEPAPTIDQMLAGTPQILGLAALDAALDIFADVDIADCYRKAQKLGDLFLDLADEKLAGTGLEFVGPRDAAKRGSQVSFRHDNAFEIVQALISRGLIGDFRAPDIARFGLTPLYLRFEDIWNGVDVMADVMKTEAWRDPGFAVRAKVT